VGIEGRVVGIEMTPEMVSKAPETAKTLGLTNAEFREGLAEALPIADGWARAVPSPRRSSASRGHLVFADRSCGTGWRHGGPRVSWR